MKIIHFSDTHLGFSEYNKIDPETGINQREQDFYDAWNSVVDAIIDKKPDLVLHAGDLFHTTRPSNRAIAVALEGIQKIGDSGIPLVCIAGNHSTPKIRATGSIFEAIELFPNVKTAFQGKYEKFIINGAAVHCVPHCALTEDLEQAFHDITLSPDADYQILLTHGAWTGSKNYSMGEFNEQIIPNPEIVLQKKFDYIALGHYHRYLEIDEHIIYSGSTERTSFNETGYTSGYLWLDLQAKHREYITIPSRNMLKLPALDCSDLSASNIYQALSEISTPELQHALVRLELKNIPHDTFLRLDWREIDKIFEQVFYLEKSFYHIEPGGNQVVTSSFDSLPIEFEKYLDGMAETELDKNRLKKMGLEYLTRELSF